METRTSLGRADRKGGTDRFRRLKHAAEQVTDFLWLRNVARIVSVRYRLEPEVWEWLEWTAACHTRGWLPASKGGTTYGTR